MEVVQVVVAMEQGETQTLRVYARVHIEQYLCMRVIAAATMDDKATRPSYMREVASACAVSTLADGQRSASSECL